MKKIILFAVAFVAFATTSLYSQDFKKEGNVYQSTKSASSRAKSEEIKTGFTWKDSKGNTYDIYIGKSGSCYIKKISAKTGNEYKQYLGEEVSRDICKQLNVEYTGKSSK